MNNDVITPQQWLELDPDPQTKAELQELLERSKTEADAEKDLEYRFSGNLSFGTAGLRARMDAGPMMMNRIVVRKAAAGLASYAKAQHLPSITAVIGYDARHNSKIFAQESAAIMVAAGITCYLMPRELPTPLLAFAVRALKADIGVMVTASHNPAADNGYKVYLGNQLASKDGNGSQIVPPADADIAKHISTIDVASIELAESGWLTVDEQIIEDYIARSATLVPKKSSNADLSIVYTAMHGVGSPIIRDVLKRTGFTSVQVVEEQDTPDANFPTVAFPNPEEKGALALAIATAKKHDADIILAHDPDADRAAVAVPTPEGHWQMLRGDQLGTLLGWQLLENSKDASACVLANSIVSSRMLGAIAQNYGAHHEETLTGFKWISRVPGLSFGYEEALGYCTDPEYVHDKDGTSALLRAAYLAACAKAEDQTLYDLLNELYLKYGVYSTDQLTVRVEDLSDIQRMMQQLRTESLTSIAGSAVTESIDLKHAHNMPATDALVYYCANNTRIIVRPSGTEPKLKCYLEAIVPVEGMSLENAHDEASARLDKVKTELAHTLGVSS